MADNRLEKVRKEVKKLHGNPYYMMAVKDVLEILDMQEEPIKDKFAFKAIPRLLDMIEPSERAKSYVTKLANAFDVEGYHTDAKIVRESLKMMNGEKVAMATMDEEPVSEELEEAANNAVIALVPSFGQKYSDGSYVSSFRDCFKREELLELFKAGAKWQKEKEYTCYEEAFEDGAKWKVENLWKPADGDDLPKIDREVIALIRMDGFFQIPPDEPVEMAYKVVFAHRPNPDGWDGKSITTGNIEHYTPETYGKGGWNIPDVKWWLDIDKLPKWRTEYESKVFDF